MSQVVSFGYSNGLKKFFGDSMASGSLIGFVGEPKIGKSFWLEDLAFRASLQKQRVLHVDAGDLGQHYVMRRYLTRAAEYPADGGSVKFPTKLIKEGDSIRVMGEERSFPNEPLDFHKAWEGSLSVKTKIGSEDSYLKLYSYPISRATVSQVSKLVADLVEQKWKPDLVILDYVDLLDAPSSEGKSILESQEIYWRQLKSLALEMDCLVVTATQIYQDPKERNYPTIEEVMEGSRRFQHVDGLIGIYNSGREERERGIFRLNWMTRRDANYDPSRFCAVAGCLGLANPSVLSVYKD